MDNMIKKIRRPCRSVMTENIMHEVGIGGSWLHASIYWTTDLQLLGPTLIPIRAAERTHDETII